MAGNSKSNTGDYSIKSFIGAIAKSGGMSMSNLYEARFDNIPDALKTALGKAGFGNLGSASDTAYTTLTLLCEEASLPGMMANTGQTTGVYMGEGPVNYAHTQAFTDITLGWTCDANLLPLKFVNTWMRHIFDGPVVDNTSSNFGSARVNRVQYPNDYQAKMTIVKAERGKNNTLEGIGGIYTLHDIFPYSIQSTPVSYGSSTLLKVSASFYYRRWEFEGVNVKKSRPSGSFNSIGDITGSQVSQ
jgi:hypothetical protein